MTVTDLLVRTGGTEPPAFLLLPHTPVNVIIFACLMGLLWLSTVPPTNALVAIMFGTAPPLRVANSSS